MRGRVVSISIVVIVCALAAGACSSREDATAARAAAIVDLPEPTPDAGAPERITVDAGVDPRRTPAGELETLSRLREGSVLSARPVSARSLSLKVRLDSGASAVFKPIRRDNGTARCEVAYYRIARLLGETRVPPSTMRELPMARLTGHLRKGFGGIADAFEAAVRATPAGTVAGAMIAWVDGVGRSGLEGAAGRARMKALLSVSGPPPEAEPMVAQASAMVTIDYVLGNWDRYSGGNLFADGAGRLVLLDNNAAFAPWSEGQRRRSDEVLAACSRFPRDLVGRLGSLTAAEIASAIEGEFGPKGGALLTAAEIDRVLSRRDALLSRVRRLIDEHGEAAILF